LEQFLYYFETIPSHHRSIILIGGITLFWSIENGLPLFKLDYKKWQHAIPNLFFTLTTVAINFLLAFILFKASYWVTYSGFGVLNWIDNLGLGLKLFLGLCLLDLFGAYLPHWIEHKVHWLWKVHIVHHSDPHVDTTTANRHHPLESVVRFIFTLIGVIIVGAPIGIIMLYQSTSIVATQFNHANISLNPKLDKILSFFIVSPNMHKVHHHFKMPYTDSNYGNIFSIWDRVFGTFSYLSPNAIRYGIDVFPDSEKNIKIWELIKQPFMPYERTNDFHSK
jgi:sterol desaturase/sphingolipid hydroxylase (fatty acid hydroxylase superfamily)